MPKVSKTSAEIHNEFPPGEEWTGHLYDTTCNIVSLHSESDLAPLLEGLPDDMCQCPHWGYVIKGQLSFPRADGEEVFNAGDAFYVAAGHTAKNAAGTDFVIFSPKDALAATEAHMAAVAGSMFATND